MRRASHQPIRVRVMGRLPLVTALAVALVACQSSEAPPKPRTNAVTATKGESKPAPSATQSAVAAKPRKDLCLGQTLRDPPGDLTSSRAAEGASAPPSAAYGKGRWVWVNVWAAWCEPCKKEMPMLLAWQQKLQKAGVPIDLVFVSIDDDARELDRFLKSQPEKGVRASYWVEGEEATEEWFTSLGFEGTPKLPVHAFVNPAGKTACVVEGSVEPGDYASVAKLVMGK
jgi:thiol-disulfide isomerase/thioredoxin